ncbi:MAG: glyceraldehyde-3-phosphate dehydrogenase [Proteobacteria bacterium]|nr:glyceraldehyde-3-phosphate dehydrogenase [Pseudomonadota bacterium]
MSNSEQEAYLDDWQSREELAEKMVPIIGNLYRKKGLVLLIYGRNLSSQSSIGILKAHKYVRHFENTEHFTIFDSFPVLEALNEMELSPCRVDLGKLALNYKNLSDGKSIKSFLEEQLAEVIQGESTSNGPQDVILYGFGRIGRLLARLLIERTGGGNTLRLKAIVVRKGKGNDLEKRASLLRRDSVHGPFNGTIQIDKESDSIIANGTCIKIVYSNSPDSIDYTKFGIQNALVIDNTGIWRDEEGLGQHLKCPGVKKAILTAPGKGDIKNIVYGVNDEMLTEQDNIVSCASCTTNAIAPVLKVVNDKYEILNGHVETVHAYTNDQNLLDNFHKKERRGRSGPLNMVLTETGAARAVSKALPELEGKLTGNAIRVPTPNVSMAIMNLNLKNGTSKEELNSYLKEVSLHSPLKGQIDFTASTEVVSTDLVGSRHAGVVDSLSTIVQDNRCVLYIWYDNEFGYSCQVVRVAERIAGIRFPAFPH